MSNYEGSILVIGKPNSGKSGFFGQLYTRLKLQNIAKADLFKTPEDVSALDKITRQYAEGKALPHTPSGEYSEIKLPIQYENEKIILKYPDYGGEQINQLLEKRRINENWYNSIRDSDEWLLFIRLNDLDKTNDPTKKFAKIVETGAKRKKDNLKDDELPSPQAFYIELLQMFLYFKNRGFLEKINSPSLTVILSCWDELENVKGKPPPKILNDELPLLNQFIEQNWASESMNIIGLSSQGKTLDKEKGDPEYYDFQEGYLITPQGNKTKDLSYIIEMIMDLS